MCSRIAGQSSGGVPWARAVQQAGQGGKARACSGAGPVHEYRAARRDHHVVPDRVGVHERLGQALGIVSLGQQFDDQLVELPVLGRDAPVKVGKQGGGSGEIGARAALVLRQVVQRPAGRRAGPARRAGCAAGPSRSPSLRHTAGLPDGRLPGR